MTGGSVFLTVSGAGSCLSVFCAEGGADATEPSVFTASVSVPAVMSVSDTVTASYMTSETVSFPVWRVISVPVYPEASVLTDCETAAVSEAG